MTAFNKVGKAAPPEAPKEEPDQEKNKTLNYQMTDKKHVRIDKYLWAVRLYKTRSIASDECRKGRIIIKDIPGQTIQNNH